MKKENWEKFKDGGLIIHFEEINDVRDFYEQGKAFFTGGRKSIFIIIHNV